MYNVEEPGDRIMLSKIQKDLIDNGFDTVQCEYDETTQKIRMSFADEEQYHFYKAALEGKSKISN